MAMLPDIIREIDDAFRAFDWPVLRRGSNNTYFHSPSLDLREDSDSYVVEVDVPGLTERDIEVNVDGDVLTIQGERRMERSGEEDGVIYRERHFGRFQRSLRIAGGIDPRGVTAELRNGVLTVRVPRPEAQRAHRIPIAAVLDGEAAEKPAEPAAEKVQADNPESTARRCNKDR